jgi:hypothetical protein
MRFRIALPVLLSVFLLASCAKQDGVPAASDLAHATVLMRDGSQLSGGVAASTPTDITLNVDGSGTRTISMKQVKSINYDDAPPASAAYPASAPPATQSAAATPATDDHENHYHPVRAAIQTRTFEVPVGAQVSVRNEETIDSNSAAEGQTYAGEVTNDVTDSDGAVVIPRGANAQIVIKSAAGGSRFHGASDLVLDLQSVSIDGRQFLISTTDLAEKGKNGIGANKRTGEFVGGGAALGAIVGAIAGHGKGALIGGAAGAGGGALTEVLTKGGSIRIPAETVMTFRLDQPLRVVERR